MIVILILLGFVLINIDVTFGILAFVFAGMFFYWTMHDRAETRQNKLHAKNHQ